MVFVVVVVVTGSAVGVGGGVSYDGAYQLCLFIEETPAGKC